MFDNSTYTKDTHLLKPKNDFVFQCLFSAKNEEITKDFISALLNEKIESIKINDTKDLYRLAKIEDIENYLMTSSEYST